MHQIICTCKLLSSLGNPTSEPTLDGLTLMGAETLDSELVIRAFQTDPVPDT